MTTLDGKQKSSVSTDINLIGRPSPLELSTVHAKTHSGQSIDEILGDDVADDVRVILDGEYISKDDWSVTLPPSGSTLEITRIPHGDSVGNILGAVLVAVVAIYAPVLLTQMGATGLVGATGAFTTLGMAVSASVFIIGGALIQPAIPDYSAPSIEQGKGYNALTATSNQPNPYGVVNKLFGSNWLTPPLAALPYSEVRVDKQYVNVMLAIGYGNLKMLGVEMPYGAARVDESNVAGVLSNGTLDLTKIKIGDTTLDNFSDYELQLGYKDDIDLFISDIFENRVSVGYSKDDEPLAVIRSTAPNTSEVSLDITFGQGLYSMNSQGTKGNDSVTFLIEYAPTGTISWVTAENPTITGNGKDPFAVSYEIKFPSDGQYDIRVTRQSTSASYSNYVYTDAVWTTLRSINRGHNFNIPNVLLLAIKMKATDQLNGSLDNVRVHAETLLPNFDTNGLTGTYSLSSNPSSAYVEAMVGVQNANPITTDRIDWDELVYWRDWCTTNSLSYNYVHSADETLLQRLMGIPTSAFGNHAIIGDKFSVVLDKTQPVSHVINPRTSNGFSAVKQFIDLPDAFRIEYMDEATGQKDEVIAYADGFDATNATKYELLSTVGVNNPEQAWKYGRYHLAQATLRPEIYTVKLDIEQLRITRGDTVKLAYDAMLVGLGWGRVTELTATELTVDEVLPFINGTSYSMLIRKEDGTTIEFPVSAPQGETRTVTWTQVVDVQVGDVFAFGESTKVIIDAKVSRVSASGGDLSATVHMVDAALNIYDAWTGTIPTFQSNVTTPIELRKPETPIITSVQSDIDNLVRNTDGSFNTSIDVSWLLPSSPVPTTHIDIKYRRQGVAEWRRIRVSTNDTNNRQLAQNINAGDNYEVSLVSVSASGNLSAPSTVELIQAYDVSDFVNVVITPTITNIDSGTTHLILQSDGTIITRVLVEWTAPNVTPDVIRYEVTYNGQLVVVDGALTSVYLTNLEDGVQYTISVRAVYRNEVYSNADSVLHTVLGKTQEPGDVINFTNSLVDRQIQLDWDEIPDLDALEYELRSGGTQWSDATLIARVKATSWKVETVGIGTNTWRIKAIDTSGHLSVNETTTNLNVVKPYKPNVTSEVVDNNVLLYWDSSPGTLPIEAFEIYKNNVLLGVKKGEFTQIFETISGDYTYKIVAVDIAGNKSDGGLVTTSVSQPPDYILNVDYFSDFSGTLTNAIVDGTVMVLPVNLSETWSEHFVNNGFTSPQDQIDAGYELYVQPSPTTASYEEVYDYGTVLSGSKVTLNLTNAVEDGDLTLSPTISLSDDNINWVDYPDSFQVYGTNFRYVKVLLDYVGVGGDDTNAVQSINIRLDSKIKNDVGSDTVTDAVNGLVVDFNAPFIDVGGIQVTPKFGGSAVNALYDFVDTPNPTSFTVYLKDVNGNNVTGEFSWSARGY